MDVGENKPRANKSSANEADYSSDQEQAKEDSTAAVGRFYECMFCRGGFTSAQALGGHMNIHRKERAMMRLINESQPAVLEGIGGPASGSGGPFSYPPASTQPSNLKSNPFSLPSSSNQEGPPVHRQSSSIILQTRSTEASCNVYVDNTEEKKEDEEELDLELRLGHGGRR